MMRFEISSWCTWFNKVYSNTWEKGPCPMSCNKIAISALEKMATIDVKREAYATAAANLADVVKRLKEIGDPVKAKKVSSKVGWLHLMQLKIESTTQSLKIHKVSTIVN